MLGNNDYGQLGNGTGGEDRSLIPVQVLGITDATTITTAEYHSCALHQDGTISCWGANRGGQLGNGTSEDSLVPVKVQGITDATAITTADHSCALHEDGTISCWGNNRNGRLGNGTENDSFVPVKVQGITDATTITTYGIDRSGHSCALHEDGTISCWGYNEYGQLGNGRGGSDGDHSSVPVQVQGITDATTITTNSGHSCALHQDGTISCWGNNDYGQLGNGTENDSFVPVQVQGITDATTITGSCALHEDGTISCWGNNFYGQLGNGTGGSDVDYSSVPVDVDYSSVPVQVQGISDATTITTTITGSCCLLYTSPSPRD